MKDIECLALGLSISRLVYEAKEFTEVYRLFKGTKEEGNVRLPDLLPLAQALEGQANMAARCGLEEPDVKALVELAGHLRVFRGNPKDFVATDIEGPLGDGLAIAQAIPDDTLKALVNLY